MSSETFAIGTQRTHYVHAWQKWLRGTGSLCEMPNTQKKDAQTPTVWWHFKWMEDWRGELLGSALSGGCELSTITRKEGKKQSR